MNSNNNILIGIGVGAVLIIVAAIIAYNFSPSLQEMLYNITFTCPENSTDPTLTLTTYIQNQERWHPTETLAEFATNRMSLLEEHHCEATLQNIAQSNAAAEQSQCEQDGQQYETQQLKKVSSDIYVDPIEYHYNIAMNACLAIVHETSAENTLPNGSTNRLDVTGIDNVTDATTTLGAAYNYVCSPSGTCVYNPIQGTATPSKTELDEIIANDLAN